MVKYSKQFSGANLTGKADYAAGFTLGNQHPDFSVTGVNAGDIVLTQSNSCP